MNIVQKITAVIALPLVLILSGCAVSGNSTPDPKASSAASQPAPTAKPTVNSLIKGFGEVVTYQDGVSVSAAIVGPYTPTNTAAGMTDGWKNVEIQIVVTNNSKDVVNLLGYPDATSGGQAATAITDIEANVGNTPTSAILPGQTLKWMEAFSVADPTNVTLQYSPTYAYKAAIFTSKAK